MRKLVLLLVAALALLAVPLSVQSQICGDVNNHPPVDLADVSHLVNFLAFGPSPVNPAMADCDGRAGITISDDVALFNYMFMEGFLDCSASGVYSSNYTVGDSVYWPRMLNIPDGIDSVSLPVRVMLQPDAQGYYLPFLNQGVGANGVFRLTAITDIAENFVAYGARGADTSVLITASHDAGQYQGVNTLFTLHYVRSTPGAGNIVPQLVDRSTLWFPSFERNGDLFRIAVVPTEQFLPPETLHASPVTLGYASMAGKVAPDSFLVSFSSTGVPISFNIASSDPWIILLNNPPTGFTTPASIWVKADATALGIGDYTGHINMIPTKPSTPKTPDAVTVTFHVIPPVTYPPGDFNCDGICDLSDLSAIISYITGGGTVLKHCNQF